MPVSAGCLPERGIQPGITGADQGTVQRPQGELPQGPARMPAPGPVASQDPQPGRWQGHLEATATGVAAETGTGPGQSTAFVLFLTQGFAGVGYLLNVS